MNKPELLAPAGDWKMLTTAVKSGADAVYFGVEKLNMRAKAKNFTSDELKEIVDFCNEHNVDTHLTINTIIYEHELETLEELIKNAKQAGVTMVICWDMSAIQLCKKYEMPFCISTQASISNSSSVEFYKSLGAQRVVLARECTLEDISKIKTNTDIEIETFVHGAMCIAVSGRCFMSHYAFGKSANRGECIQPCRREFEIKDKDDEYSFILGSDYVLSPEDLCSIQFIDKIIEAGIESFKIEGRKRSPEYIAKVVSTYRSAIDKYFDSGLTQEDKDNYEIELKKVYNRGFSHGFYFGTPGKDEYSGQYGSKATTRKTYVGKVINYFKKSSVAHIKLEASGIKPGEDLYIIGSSTGVVETKVKPMLKDSEPIEEGLKGEEITMICEDVVRPRDQVYKIVNLDE